MTLLTRILSEKRLLVAVVALGLIAAIGLYTLGVYPQSARLREAHERQVEAAESLIAAQRDQESVQVTMAEKASAAQELEIFYGEILPAHLAGARGITYPRLAALARAHNLVMERRTGVSERDEKSELGKLRTNMLLGGEWADIRQFVDDLENGPEFIVIEDIRLGQSEDAGSSLVLNLGLATYYQAGDGA
jgi:Tfp pilus assembly protein PilO